MRKSYIAFLFFFVIFVGAQWALFAKSLKLPAKQSQGEIPQSLLSEIRKELQKERYKISSAAEGSKAVNCEHRFRISFKNEGITISPKDDEEQWSFSMAAKSLGREGQKTIPLTTAKIHRADNRIELHRGAVTEWYVNDKRGLEQGFTVETNPCPHNGHPLCVTLNVKGNLTPELLKQSNTILLRDNTGKIVMRYGGLKCWDAKGTHIPSVMKLTPATPSSPMARIALLVHDGEAQYSLTIDPVFSAEQRDKLLASDGASGDLFGGAVAISGDYAIVGACYDDDKGFNSGTAYIFRRSGNSWTQEAKLTADDGAESDFFGESVAISGDYAIVGASANDVLGNSTAMALLTLPL